MNCFTAEAYAKAFSLIHEAIEEVSRNRFQWWHIEKQDHGAVTMTMDMDAAQLQGK
jgi:hypothetical protein